MNANQPPQEPRHRFSDADIELPFEVEDVEQSERVRRFGEVMASRDCVVITPEDEEAVLHDPQLAEMIRNDGKMTFLVHSTTIANAESILGEGMRLPEAPWRPGTPNLAGRFIMMAGPKDGRDQAPINAQVLAYHYDNGFSADEPNDAKVVFALPMQNPGTNRKYDPFQRRLLSRGFDHRMEKAGILQRQTAEDGTNEFIVGAPYAVGYFNQVSQEFIHNEHYDTKPTDA
jgi:hypothetical protein